MKPTSSRRQRTLDVRPLITQGRQPFPAIMAAVAGLQAGEALVLVTPFLPSPLIERLRGDGFDARLERRADGSWQTRFSRP